MTILNTTLLWFWKAVPKPQPKNITTQMGVHFEEVREMLVELTPRDMLTHTLLIEANIALKKLADHLKANVDCVTVLQANRIKYIDALCDQIVTATGCAHMSNMDIISAMTEVNRSNFSKFDANGNPIFDENMKVKKSPDYTEANLAPFV